MEDIVFPTFEDLLKIDEAEFVRLEDFEITSLYKDLHNVEEKPTQSVQAVPKGYDHGIPDSKFNLESYQHEELDISTPKEKIFMCELCGKGYSNRRSLMNHSFLHTGVYPYFCELCHRGFRFHSKLKEHRRTEPYCFRRHLNFYES